MLLSMTGQGQGRRQIGSSEINVEVRAVNNRHLKVHTRLSEGLGSLEQKIETVVRKNLRRGSLQLTVQLSGGSRGSNYNLQESVIESYLKQCKSMAERLGVKDKVSIRDLLLLPGVVADPRNRDWEQIDAELESNVLATVEEALASLNAMRKIEGESMSEELSRQLTELRELIAAIETRAPEVLEEYRERLKLRLTKSLGEVGFELNEADLLREVLVMADKADIREEIVRARSHFDQFENLLEASESQGRKLDFLIQELFRETNTIGSKAADSEISQRVVDMKTAIEQMRELVQNVE